MFLIYINDLSSVSKILTAILFADDTTLINSNKCLNTLVDRFNKELKNIVNWLNANRLSLNIDKTNFMVFKGKNKNHHDPHIMINGSCIDQVQKAKFLGVIIDCNLRWTDHIKHVTQKISKGIGIIIKARKYFNCETLLNLYNTLILPYISYCIHVWGTAANVYSSKIHILQKKIVRIIDGAPPRTHSQPLFDKLKIMTIYQLYRYYIGVFMYKLYHKLLPSIFSFFKLTSDVHSYPTRQNKSYYINYAPTVRSQKTIKITGPKLWNIILKKINIQNKISSYKVNLKKFLLSKDDS